MDAERLWSVTECDLLRNQVAAILSQRYPRTRLDTQQRITIRLSSNDVWRASIEHRWQGPDKPGVWVLYMRGCGHMGWPIGTASPADIADVIATKIKNVFGTRGRRAAWKFGVAWTG